MKVRAFHAEIFAFMWNASERKTEFAYLTTNNISFPRFARASFIFGHFADVLVREKRRF